MIMAECGSIDLFFSRIRYTFLPVDDAMASGASCLLLSSCMDGLVSQVAVGNVFGPNEVTGNHAN